MAYNGSAKRPKLLSALTPFPSIDSSDGDNDSGSDIEIMDGLWRPKDNIGKDIDKGKGKGKAADVGGNRWEANVAGPSSGHRWEPADSTGVIYTCNELIQFVKEDGQNLGEDTKAILCQLQGTLDEFLGL